MSSRSNARRRPAFSDEVQALGSVPTPASEALTTLHPIEDGVWRTDDRVTWRLHRELSSAGVIRELLGDSNTRVLWVDGPDAREMSASQAVAAWGRVEREFKQQYRRNGDPQLRVDVAEFRDAAGLSLVIIEVVC